MERIIKFRAWHKGYPEAKIEPQMLYDEDPGDCLNYLKQGQPVEVMQYTGKNDMSGVEVYEDDVIQYDLLAGLDEPAKTGLRRVVKITPYGAFGRWDTNIKVIGNIHANPELIKS